MYDGRTSRDVALTGYYALRGKRYTPGVPASFQYIVTPVTLILWHRYAHRDIAQGQPVPWFPVAWPAEKRLFAMVNFIDNVAGINRQAIHGSVEFAAIMPSIDDENDPYTWGWRAGCAGGIATRGCGSERAGAMKRARRGTAARTVYNAGRARLPRKWKSSPQ